MASALNTFVHQRGVAKSAGIAIVRNIFRKQQFPDGVSTKQLYRLALKEPAPPDFQPYPLGRPPAPKPKHTKPKRKGTPAEPEDTYPPNPDHPVRSIRFLKTEILAELKALEEINTFRQAKAGARIAEDAPTATKNDRKKLAASQMEFVWRPLPPKPAPPQPSVKAVFGREVGVGADISHLNKRRQRARVEKVSLAVQKMKAIENGFKPRTLASRPLYRNNKSTTDDAPSDL